MSEQSDLLAAFWEVNILTNRWRLFGLHEEPDRFFFFLWGDPCASGDRNSVFIFFGVLLGEGGNFLAGSVCVLMYNWVIPLDGIYGFLGGFFVFSPSPRGSALGIKGLGLYSWAGTLWHSPYSHTTFFFFF
jgi:hypothetical protein